MQIGIAILGVGRWGTHLIRNFHHHPLSRIVAVVDPDPEKLSACTEKLGLDETVVMATQWEAVRQLADIDAVVVVTPASTHYTLIADALRLGYHVLSEKPLTLEPSQCQELVHLAQKQQRQLFIDHTYLFHPAVAQGQQILQSGKLGKLRYGYATRTHLGPVRYDVDALWDLAIHDLCIFNHWLGEVPTQVQATGTMWLQPAKINSPNQLFPQGLADVVWAKLFYASGFQAHLHLCWLNPDKQRRLCVVGSEGTLIFDEMSTAAPLSIQQGYLQQKEGYYLPRGQNQSIIHLENEEPLRRMCDAFLASVANNSPSSITSGEVGLQLVQVLSCLSQSLHQGGEIIVVPALH